VEEKDKSVEEKDKSVEELRFYDPPKYGLFKDLQ